MQLNPFKKIKKSKIKSVKFHVIGIRKANKKLYIISRNKAQLLKENILKLHKRAKIKYKVLITKLTRFRYYKVLVRVGIFIVGLFGIYLIMYPFFPGIVYHIFHKNKEVYPYQTQIVETELEGQVLGNKKIPIENRIVIPSISVDMPIVEGTTENVLNLGIWHRPGTGVPGKGNMVLTGHRVGYAFLPDDVKNSTSFYNLDKLKKGDYVIIYWKEKEYDYEVESFEIVDKSYTSIEEETFEERLTLYTCHPIGQNDKRLVYFAKPLQRSN